MYKSGLVDLEVVLAIARRQSFRAAATELDMSTTAVSNAVAALEARMGVRLFHRSTRSVSLTESGARFVAQIEPAVFTIQAAISLTTGQDLAPTGTLRINSSLGAALMIFQPILAEYIRRHPGMVVDISTEGKMVDIIAEGFDAGLRTSSKVPLDMIRVPINSEVPVAIVGSAEYLSTHPKPRVPEDLAKHSCIRARLPSGVHSPWELLQNGESFKVDVHGPLVLDTPQLMLQAVNEGMGLAQLPLWYLKDGLKDGSLITVLDTWASPAPGLALYYSGHRHIPPGLRALIKVIQEHHTPEALR